MKIIEGNFKKENKSENRSVYTKIIESLEKIKELHGDEVEGNYILLTDVNKEIYISSDLPAEDFNFLLDTAKLNVLYSSTIHDK